MTTIRFGIVGTGNIAHRFAEAIRNTKGAVLTAVASRTAAGAEAFGNEFDIPHRFAGYEAMAASDAIDAAYIAVPHSGHMACSVLMMEHGKHVLCEKPMALTREDTDAMIRAADASGHQMMVGQICRFTPAFEKAKELVDDGTLGDLYFLESEYAHDYMKIVDNWRADPDRHGVIGGGCHAVDLLRWLAGDPQEVFAYGMHKLLPQVAYDDATKRSIIDGFIPVLQGSGDPLETHLEDILATAELKEARTYPKNEVMYVRVYVRFLTDTAEWSKPYQMLAAWDCFNNLMGYTFPVGKGRRCELPICRGAGEQGAA